MSRYRTLVVGLVVLGAAIGLAGCDRPAGNEAAPVQLAADPEVAAAALVERGHYLVWAGHCHDCHTPWVMAEGGPEPDMTRMLSGHPEELVMPPPPELPEGPWLWVVAGTNTAFAGPWGVTYSPNLTPEENTGLGIWTEEMFTAAMRQGRHMGQGRPIMPPMPWPNVAKLTDDDIQALFAYLQSIPAIVNRVPDYAPPGP